MKNKILIAFLSIGLFATAPLLAQEKGKSKVVHQKIENATYTCPMHADVKSNKPGDCPKCGMALKAIDAKKGSCCPKQTNESTVKSNKKSTCTRNNIKTNHK